MNKLFLQIKVGGLDAYSGYWLALDSPSVNHKDALQEEGIDTLQRLIAAANIPVTGSFRFHSTIIAFR